MKNFLEENDSPLNEKLVYALDRINVAIRAENWEVAGDLGINPTQKQILLLVSQRSFSLRLSEIADELVVSAATVSDSVSTLVEKDLLTKERAVDDGRAIAVRLTAKGKKAVRKLCSADHMMLEILERLPAEEKDRFYKTLIGIIRELQIAERIPAARMCVTCRYFRPNAHDSKSRPHHCNLVDLAFGDGTIRVDCPDHEAV